MLKSLKRREADAERDDFMDKLERRTDKANNTPPSSATESRRVDLTRAARRKR
jgi:hypothetical protein